MVGSRESCITDNLKKKMCADSPLFVLFPPPLFHLKKKWLRKLSSVLFL